MGFFTRVFLKLSLDLRSELDLAQRAFGSKPPPNTLFLVGTGKWSTRPLGSSLGAGRGSALDLQTNKVWLVAITSAVGASELQALVS